METENAELKLKLSSTENNVIIFVKEMSDLFDTHEISTNGDSQELNFSMTNSNNALLEEPPELERNIKTAKISQKNNYKKNIFNGVKENKILLSQENLLISKK
jgi:hypothetical protein